MAIANELLNRIIIPKLASYLDHLTNVKIVSNKKLDKKIILYLNYNFLVHFDGDIFNKKIGEEEYPKINLRYKRWAALKKPLEVIIDFKTNEITFTNIYKKSNLKYGKIKDSFINPDEISVDKKIELIKDFQNDFEIKNKIAPVKKALPFEYKTKQIEEDDLKDSLNSFVSDLADDLNSSAENMRIISMRVISRPEKVDKFKYKSVIELESNIMYVNSETYTWSNIDTLKQRGIIHSEVSHGNVYHMINLKPVLADTPEDEIIDLDTEHLIIHEIKDEDGSVNKEEDMLRKKAREEIKKQFNDYDGVANKYKRTYKI